MLFTQNHLSCTIRGHFIEHKNTVVPPNSQLIGSKKTRELRNPGIKRLNNSSKPFQPKVATVVPPNSRLIGSK